MKLFAAQIAAASKTPLPYSIQTLALIQLIQGVLLSPILNGLFTFGEEFGWRAYLLPKLMPLGGRKAVLISGVIWGIWHWPIIAMGHNYGLDYPGAPWLGMLLMVVFTVTIGALISWATIKAGSVWPAVIGHAAINGIAALAALAMQGSPSTLLGPFPTGLVGGIAFTALAIILFALPRAFMPVEEAA